MPATSGQIFALG